MSSFSQPASEPLAAAAAHQFWSVDSAPATLTQPLSIWVAPAVLMLFTGIATLLLLLVNHVPALVEAFPNHDIIFSPYSGTHSVPLRIFILSFYVAFAAVVGAGGWARLRFLGELIFSFVLVCGLFDLINILAFRAIGLVYSLHVVAILSGLIGFYVFSLKLLEHGSMPARAAVPGRIFTRRFVWLRLGVAIIGGIALSVLVDRLELPLVRDLRGVALLGGTGPGVFLFLPAMFFILYVWGTLLACLRPLGAFAPALTVIIPAHNEAHVISRTLAAIEAAARHYDGPLTVLVLNNNSSDDTAAVAEKTFAHLPLIRGRVVEVPMPGKSAALNRGVMQIETDYFIRIDADTQVFSDAFARAMRHFSHEQTGVVGGLPLPPGTGPFDRARLLEVLLRASGGKFESRDLLFL